MRVCVRVCVCVWVSQLEGLSHEEKSAAESEWAAAKEVALQKAREREAAVVLLQRRLPVLLARKRVVDKCRDQATRYAHAHTHTHTRFAISSSRTTL